MSGQEWRLRAACRGDTSDAQVGGATAQRGFIRQFCRHCEVRSECLRFAVEHDSDGVYGGMTRRQRHQAGLVPKRIVREPAEVVLRRAPAGRRKAQCGTRSGYAAHRDRGEEKCEACKQAQRDADAARWAGRSA